MIGKAGIERAAQIGRATSTCGTAMKRPVAG
jgi:hypothetical protein